jgi:DNA helicase HerA-like ATPase
MTGTATSTVTAPPGRTEGTALSLDGRRFECAVTVESGLETGTFVALRTRGSAALGQTELGQTQLGQTQLGQIEALHSSPEGSFHGSGRILGTVAADGRSLDTRASRPFDAAEITRADATALESLYGGAAHTMPIGEFLGGNGPGRQRVPARLLTSRFNRHTFWCGQSGSGKTYALGVVLEQLLLTTRLPMVVFDPNGDFVQLPGVLDPDSPEGRTLASRDIRVLRPSSALYDPLRVRFVDMPLAARAALLHLDPLADREEFGILVRIEETVGSVAPENVVPTLISQGGDGARSLAARIENLRLIDWSVWAGEFEAVTDVLEARPDATVLDVGGFAYPDEGLVVALAVLDDLWAKREQRRPILIVIDEAHNLCSPEGTSPLQVAVRNRLVQIAAEGRKFGLWLLLSTQRPSRVHPSIVSQCDNLALMKMSSPVDLDELGTVFGFVPPALLAMASGFRQGEALFAGGFVPAPSLVRMGDRLTREAGVDITVPLRDG